jgi:hypothetical protein
VVIDRVAVCRYRSSEEAPDQLFANPANWRIHPKAQQDALAGALDQVGWVQQVPVNRRTGFVVDGHAWVALALTRGEATVPVLSMSSSTLTRRRWSSRPSTRSARWPGATARDFGHSWQAARSTRSYSPAAMSSTSSGT